ncbi:MAG: acyltransferase [Lachnospiraceae bacterium]|nr:acyltransferase [Lachnospiraceae bacterium]
MIKIDKHTKDICVEMLRIVGMLIVVLVHVKPLDYIGGAPDAGRVFISAVLADGVPIFWFILGFFLFRKNSGWGYVLKRTGKRVFIPLILYSCFVWFLGDFLLGEAGLFDSILHTGEEYGQVLKFGILKWTNVLPMSGQIWYLYVYIAAMIFYPAIKGFWDVAVRNSQRKHFYLLGIILLMIINDLFTNRIFYFSHTGIHGVLGAGFFILAGAILYQYKDNIAGKFKWGVTGGILITVSCIIRALVQYFYYLQNPGMPYFLNWYTSFSMITAIGFVLFVYGFFGKIEFSLKARQAISHFGTLSFYVYLVHMILLECLSAWDVTDWIRTFIGETWWGDIVFTAGYGGFILILSLLVSELLYWVLKIIKNFIPTKQTTEIK